MITHLVLGAVHVIFLPGPLSFVAKPSAGFKQITLLLSNFALRNPSAIICQVLGPVYCEQN